MNRDQRVHVGMINSYNIIMGYKSILDISMSSVGVFAHAPEGLIEFGNVELIMRYFQSIEMYEYCSNLKKYIKKNFDKNGERIIEECECDLPAIKEYSTIVKCSICNKFLIS